jgi:hypothetical protein
MQYLVKIGNVNSETFTANNGLKQGDAIAPLLFNVVLEMVLRKANVNTKCNIIRNTSQILAYADDIAILTRDLDEMKQMFTNIEREAASAGLIINDDKTKVMILDRANPPVETSINFAQHTFDIVTDFIYLGANLNTNNNTSIEIQRRLFLGNRCVAALHHLLKSRLLSRTSKLKMYSTLILPVVTYGCETWTISRQDEEKLLVFERKILRKIYGPVKEGDEWRIRMNHELQAIYEKPNIMGIIKSRRLGWYGHLLRMPPERMVSQIFHKIPANKRPKGRPRARWVDNIQQDLKCLRLTNHRTVAQNRAEWRRVIEEAKIHFGL